MNAGIQCPVCLNSMGGKYACRPLALPADQDSYGFDCDVCGEFLISGTAYRNLLFDSQHPDHPSVPYIERSTLSHRLRIEAGKTERAIISSNWREYYQIDIGLPNREEQINNIIRYVGDMESRSGGPIAELPPSYPAIIGAQNLEVANQLTIELVNQDLLRCIDFIDQDESTVVTLLNLFLSEHGWDKYNDLIHNEDSTGDNGRSISISEQDEIEKSIDSIISQANQSTVFPKFKFGENDLLQFDSIHRSESDLDHIDGTLVTQLKELTHSLKILLEGTNVHTDLLNAVDLYNSEFSNRIDQKSIPCIYVLGVRLENAFLVTQQQVQADNLLSLPPTVEEIMNSILEVHGAFIMSNEEGRNLVQSAASYRLTPNQASRLISMRDKLGDAVEESRDIFDDKLKTYMASISRETGKGRFPERSNQSTIIVFTGVITTLLSQILIRSNPGEEIISAGVGLTNRIWAFLSSITPFLKVIAAATIGELPWMESYFRLINHIRKFKLFKK